MNETILVVEDDWELRNPIVVSLQAEGYRVASAGDGRAAMDLIEKGLQPDLILMDLMMPGVSGWEFRNRLLKDPELSDIPVVVMTGYAERVQDKSIAEVLEKPIDVDKLLTRVGELLAVV